MDIKQKRAWKELFNTIDAERCGKVTLQQVIDFYEEIGARQLKTYTEMYGSNVAKSNEKMAGARMFNQVLTELFKMRQHENKGVYVNFADFLVIHAKAKEMATNSDQYTLPSSTFPFTSLSYDSGASH